MEELCSKRGKKTNKQKNSYIKQLTNLPDKFKVKVIKILTALEKTGAGLNVDLNKEIERLKENQSKMKNT